jgi:hypothetical protein
MLFLLRHGAHKRPMLEKNGKGSSTSTNFLEIMVNDEQTILAMLNHLCGT